MILVLGVAMALIQMVQKFDDDEVIQNQGATIETRVAEITNVIMAYQPVLAAKEVELQACLLRSQKSEKELF